MLGISLDRNNFKPITNVMDLNRHLDSHIKISVGEDEEFIKASKLIRIVNSILDEYDTTLLYNKKAFEKTKAYMIKDLVKNKTVKLTKDVIKKHIDNRLTGSRAFSLRRK